MSRIRSAFAAGWPTARAILILLAMIIGLVNGCPMGQLQKGPTWSRPAVAAISRVRAKILAPVAWIGEDLDIDQRWALFRGASHKRWRMYIEGQKPDGTWEILFRAGDPDHTAYRAQLEYRRIRGTFNPSGQRMRGQYPLFAGWMTRRVLDEHSEYVASRTRFERIRIKGGSYTPTGEFQMERVLRRPGVTPPPEPKPAAVVPEPLDEQPDPEEPR